MATPKTPKPAFSPKLYGISAAAALAGIAENTLRNYELRGWVVPVRDSSNKRLYSLADIEAARARARNYRGRPPKD